MATFGAFCLAVLSADGTSRDYVPATGFGGFTGSLERYGGMQAFSLTFTAEVGTLASIKEGEVVEAYYAGKLRYRGKVEDVTRAKGEPDTLRVTGNGVSFEAGMQEVQGEYLYPQPTDVSVAFADVAREAVQPALPGLTVQAQAVGATIDQLDGTYRQAGAAFNDLITGSAENLAVWGGDVDLDPASPTYLADRLYIRPVSTKADQAVLVPGPRTEAGALTTSLADVKNRLRVMGGPNKYPNLLYNGSFERLRFGGPESGNLLLNASFEANVGGTAGLADHWTVTGGAFVHDASDGTGAAYQGDRLLKIDVGGQAEQTHNTAGTVTPGTPYVVGVYAARESGAATGVGRLTLQWLGGGDSPVGAAVTLTVNPTGATYDVFETTQAAPDGATGLRVTLDLSTVVGAGSGIKFDEAFAFDASTVFADKWEIYTYGAAGVTLQDWRARGAYDGLRCLLCHVTAADADGQDAHLRPAGGERCAVTSRQTLVLSCRLKGAWPKLLLQIEEFKSDGSFNMVTAHTVASGSSAAWALQSMSKTLDSATSHVHAYLTFRGSTTGDLYVDAMSLRDAAAPAGEFVRDGNFTAIFDSDDSSLVGVSTNAVNSRTLYTGGVPRYEQVSSDLITTLADARTYAAAWFNAHAVPLPQSPVTVLDDARAFVPGQGVKLVGADGPTLMAGRDFLPVMRVGLAFGADGLWRQSLELQQEVKDEAEEFLEWLKRKNRLTALGPAGATTAGTSTGASPPINGPLAVTDGTLTVHNVDLLKLTRGVLSSAATGEADWFPQDADATHKGVTTLSHDFGGTADAPEVVGIRTIPVTDAAPTDGQGLVYRASGADIEWGDVGADAIIPVETLPTAGPATQGHFYRLLAHVGPVASDTTAGTAGGPVTGLATLSLTFDADLQGVTDAGGSPAGALPLAWVGGDGGPDPGVAGWTASGALSGTLTDLATLAGTWEDWGVPPGSTVQSVRIRGFEYRVPSHAGLSAWSADVSVWAGGSPAMPSLGSLEDTSFPLAWTAYPTNSWVAVGAPYAPSDTALTLRLALTAHVAGTVAADIRLDSLALEIAYAAPAGSGGSGTAPELDGFSAYIVPASDPTHPVTFYDWLVPNVGVDPAPTGGADLRLEDHTSADGTAWVRHPADINPDEYLLLETPIGTDARGGAVGNGYETLATNRQIYYADQPVSTDFDLTLPLAETGASGSGAGLAARLDDSAQTGYWAGALGNEWVLVKVVGGTPTTLASAPHAFAGSSSAPEVNRIRLNGAGPVLTFYVNGGQALQATDHDLTQGRVGLWSVANGAPGFIFGHSTAGESLPGGTTGGGTSTAAGRDDTVWFSKELHDGTYAWEQVNGARAGAVDTAPDGGLPAPTLPGQILFSLDGATAKWVLPLTDPDFGWMVTDDGEMMVTT